MRAIKSFVLFALAILVAASLLLDSRELFAATSVREVVTECPNVICIIGQDSCYYREDYECYLSLGGCTGWFRCGVS